MERATKYYIVFISLTISLVCSLLFLNHRVYQHDYYHLKQQAIFSLGLIAEQVAQQISSDILAVSNSLTDFSSLSSVNKKNVKIDHKRLETIFNDLKKFHIESVELINANGERTFSVSAPGWSPHSIPSFNYYTSLQTDSTNNSIYKILPGSETPDGTILLIQAPVLDGEGKLKGAVSAYIPINQLVEKYCKQNSHELYFWLLERNGTIVYYPDNSAPSLTGQNTAMNSSMAQFINKLSSGELYQGEYRAPDGRNTLAAASVVDGYGKDLLLVFATHEDNFKNLLKHFHSDHVIATLVIVFLLIGGSLFVLITIARWNNALHQEIVERKETEKQKERLICELEQALSEIDILSGFLPICASCKKIRDDKGYWNQVEVYISKHSQAQFSHGICPDCREKLYPNFSRKKSA